MSKNVIFCMLIFLLCISLEAAENMEKPGYLPQAIGGMRSVDSPPDIYNTISITAEEINISLGDIYEISKAEKLSDSTRETEITNLKGNCIYKIVVVSEDYRKLSFSQGGSNSKFYLTDKKNIAINDLEPGKRYFARIHYLMKNTEGMPNNAELVLVYRSKRPLIIKTPPEFKTVANLGKYRNDSLQEVTLEEMFNHPEKYDGQLIIASGYWNTPEAFYGKKWGGTKRINPLSNPTHEKMNDGLISDGEYALNILGFYNISGGYSKENFGVMMIYFSKNDNNEYNAKLIQLLEVGYK